MKEKENKRKLEEALLKNKKMAVELLREDWDAIQKGAKKEEIVRRVKESVHSIEEVLLTFVVFGVDCVVSAALPGVFGVFDRRGRRRTLFNEKKLKRDLYYCKRRKYLRWEKTGENEYRVSVTEKGLRRALQEGFKEIKKRNKKWDGSWRVIAFDIPEKRRWARDGFREKLKHLGFYQMQQSVFVSPYPYDKEIRFFISVFGVEPYTSILKAKEIDCENMLMKWFEL